MPYTVNRKRIQAISKVFQNKIQLPAEVRETLSIKDGDKIVWYVDAEGKWIIEKA